MIVRSQFPSASYGQHALDLNKYTKLDIFKFPHIKYPHATTAKESRKLPRRKDLARYRGEGASQATTAKH